MSVKVHCCSWKTCEPLSADLRPSYSIVLRYKTWLTERGQRPWMIHSSQNISTSACCHFKAFNRFCVCLLLELDNRQLFIVYCMKCTGVPMLYNAKQQWNRYKNSWLLILSLKVFDFLAVFWMMLAFKYVFLWG